jgi:hypothetical protein
MIGEFARYHGAAVRDLIVGAGQPICIEASDDLGRVNTYIVDGTIGVYIKHSSKRLPPWSFTYQNDHVAELERLSAQCKGVWLVHVCGHDGLVALSLSEFRSINSRDTATTSFVRVDRDRNTMYRVNGTGGKLPRSKRRGLHCIFEDLTR